MANSMSAACGNAKRKLVLLLKGLGTFWARAKAVGWSVLNTSETAVGTSGAAGMRVTRRTSSRVEGARHVALKAEGIDPVHLVAEARAVVVGLVEGCEGDF